MSKQIITNKFTEIIDEVFEILEDKKCMLPDVVYLEMMDCLKKMNHIKDMLTKLRYNLDDDMKNSLNKFLIQHTQYFMNFKDCIKNNETSFQFAGRTISLTL